MGYYLNPTAISKERWLALNGLEVFDLADTLASFNSLETAVNRLWNTLKRVEVDKPAHWVCLVDNIGFSVAGVAYSKDELRAFLRLDSRRKRLFSVPDRLIIQLCPEVERHLEALA